MVKEEGINMKLKEIIEKVEQINTLKSELGLEEKTKVIINSSEARSVTISTLSEFKEYTEQFVKEVQDLLNSKKSTKVKTFTDEHYQLCDIYTCGEYTYPIEFSVYIY